MNGGTAELAQCRAQIQQELFTEGAAPHETSQTVSFVILEHRALGCMVQKHLGSLRELEFARAYEIWVMLILLI